MVIIYKLNQWTIFLIKYNCIGTSLHITKHSRSAPRSLRLAAVLGLALIPQAGVAIGLAAMGARTLGGASGSALETIILASSVLYELIGPGCAKLSLYLSKSYSNKLEDIVEIAEDGHQKSKVELLIERIQAIQNDLPKHENPYYEDEQAFSEAADEQYLLAGMSMDRSRKNRRRRR